MKVEEEVNSLKIIRIFLTEVAQAGHVETIDKITSIDMVDEANQAFGGPPGRDGLVAHVVGFRRNVGDLEVRIDRIVTGTDEVMAQWSFTGKHVGPWLGRAPTNQEIAGTIFSFFSLVDGKISHYRVWLHARLDEPVVFDSANPTLQ